MKKCMDCGEECGSSMCEGCERKIVNRDDFDPQE